MSTDARSLDNISGTLWVVMNDGTEVVNATMGKVIGVDGMVYIMGVGREFRRRFMNTDRDNWPTTTVSRRFLWWTWEEQVPVYGYYHYYKDLRIRPVSAIKDIYITPDDIAKAAQEATDDA